MTIHVALLRGINVAGHKMVSMADLRGLFAELGFADAQTLLQSGNLVFRSDAGRAPALERLLESEAEKRLGLRTDFLLRSAAQWKGVVAANPFPREAKRDPSRLLVTFLKGRPKTAAVHSLEAAVSGPEVLHCKGRELYIVYPNGVGRSRLTNALIEKKLAMRGTGRNWNTVLKLAALASSS